MVKQREGYKLIILEPAKTRIQNKQCPSCGKSKKHWKRRSDWRCCSRKCTDVFDRKHVIYGWPHLRTKTFIRDNYTCEHCGVRPTREFPVMKEDHDGKEPILREENHGHCIYYYVERGAAEELIGDHIVPIALGGDEWDINNIQTLCIPCNKVKTVNDIKKIAELRRIEKTLTQGQVTL